MNLYLGSVGPDVGNWQRFLNEQAAGLDTALLPVDEIFDDETRIVTRLYQEKRGLEVDGIVGPATYATAVMDGYIPFVAAKNCLVLHPRERTSVDLIVIHTTESPEMTGEALIVAQYFAGPNAPMASAHYVIDDKDVIQCVREGDVAYHAPGANRYGIGIEHVGRAAQTAADWSDAYSTAVLERSARLVAAIAKRWNVPVVRLSPDDLKKGGARGICGHVDVTNGLNNGQGHQDPGVNFPWDDYLARVTQFMV